jgi:hypothetical protein
MLNRGLLPFSTDLVFGVEGYDVTFTPEANDFEPATPPPESNGQVDQDDPKSSGDGTLDNNNPDQHYRNPRLCLESGSVPRAKQKALGIEKNTRQRFLYQEPTG